MFSVLATKNQTIEKVIWAADLWSEPDDTPREGSRHTPSGALCGVLVQLVLQVTPDFFPAFFVY